MYLLVHLLSLGVMPGITIRNYDGGHKVCLRIEAARDGHFLHRSLS